VQHLKAGELALAEEGISFRL